MRSCAYFSFAPPTKMPARRSRVLLSLMYLLVLKRIQIRLKNARKKRRWSVNPIWRKRNTEGHYNCLLKSIREEDPSYFKTFLRMSSERFDYLTELVSPHLKKRYSGERSINPGHRLAITLRFLATGDSLPSLSFAFRLGISTVHYIIAETCDALWKVLQPKYLPAPSSEIWTRNEVEYCERWNFPMCCGAVDGKNVIMQQPAKSGTLFFNYKGLNSIVLMAVVDANCTYTAVDIGAYGSHSDSGIWNASPIGREMQEGRLGLPAPKCLPETQVSVPHVLVGDEAFQLRPDFMRPFPAKGLTMKRRVFNYRLSRARRCSECCFGITANRWRVFRRPLLTNPTNTELIVKAVVVLHNFLMAHLNDRGSDQSYCPPGYKDYVDDNGVLREGNWRNDSQENGALQPAFPSHARRYSQVAGEVRDKFANYFVTDGEVPWQWHIPGMKGLSYS